MKLTLKYADYRAKIYAGWMGKSIGGAIGARMENHKALMHLTHDELWPDQIVANDDMDIQIVWLEALQERGIWIDSNDLADYWQDRCWYNFCEYGVFLNNVQRGINPPLSGVWNNRFFYESEGCPIRSELWGMVSPGNPALAAEYARNDAQLDHGGAGVLCEMFLSAAAAAAFFDDDLDRVLSAGLAVIPAGSVVHNMLAQTRAVCADHPRFEDAWRLIVRRFGDRDASKAIMNQAIVVMALLLGRGDFAETMRLACNSGWDTDCTAATAGALLGLMHGSDIFPVEWVDKMGKSVTCGIKVKHQFASFDELTDDTARVGMEVTSQRTPDVDILGGPAIAIRPQRPLGVRMAAEYPVGPVLRHGQNTPVRINLTNHGSESASGTWSIELSQYLTCSCQEGVICLAPGEEVAIELLMAPKPGPVWDNNLCTARWRQAGKPEFTYVFGLGGARLWRVYGPYWDMWDTEKNQICPYSHDNVFAFPEAGDSWNHYARLGYAYLDEDRLLREDIPGELPEEVQIGEDYIDGPQIAGFRGQACFYLVRELVSTDDREVGFHVTCNAPFAVWFDGVELTRCESGREVSPQDGHVGPVKLGSVPKRLVIKIARQIDALSLLVVAIDKRAPDTKRGISMFADCLGDVPMKGSRDA